RCRDRAAPIRVMRIIDDTARLIRAAEVSFLASEVGYDAFGYNVVNRDLVQALEDAATQHPSFSRIDATAVAADLDQRAATVRLSNGTQMHARLAIAADGRNSLLRAAAGIATDRHAYRQTALALNLRHTRPHNDISTEFHTETGPFTLVPLTGLRSA